MQYMYLASSRDDQEYMYTLILFGTGGNGKQGVGGMAEHAMCHARPAAGPSVTAAWTRHGWAWVWWKVVVENS